MSVVFENPCFFTTSYHYHCIEPKSEIEVFVSSLFRVFILLARRKVLCREVLMFLEFVVLSSIDKSFFSSIDSSCCVVWMLLEFVALSLDR